MCIKYSENEQFYVVLSLFTRYLFDQLFFIILSGWYDMESPKIIHIREEILVQLRYIPSQEL